MKYEIFFLLTKEKIYFSSKTLPLDVFITAVPFFNNFNLDEFKKGLELRGLKESVADELIALNQKRKEKTTTVERTQAEIKKISKDVGARKMKGQDATGLMSDVQTLKNSVATTSEELEEVTKDLNYRLSVIPNKLAEDHKKWILCG